MYNKKITYLKKKKKKLVLLTRFFLKEREVFLFFLAKQDTFQFPHVIIYFYIFLEPFSLTYIGQGRSLACLCVCSAFLWSFRYSKRSNTEEVCFHSQHQFLSLTQSPIIWSFFPSNYASKSLQVCQLNQIDLQLLMGIALCTNCK